MPRIHPLFYDVIHGAAGGTKERPWSAILSPEDHSSLTLPICRRHTGIMPFHGNNLSKSLSIHNIAGYAELPYIYEAMLLCKYKMASFSPLYSVQCLMRCQLKASDTSRSLLTPSTEPTRSQSPWSHSPMKVKTCAHHSLMISLPKTAAAQMNNLTIRTIGSPGG